MSGLHIDVYRDHFQDCTNGGVSSKHHTLTVVNISGPFGPTPDSPAVLLVDGPGNRPNPIIVPAIQDDETGSYNPAPGWYMAGGNYAASCDSRFARAVEQLGGTPGMAVKIHDRKETGNA